MFLEKQKDRPPKHRQPVSIEICARLLWRQRLHSTTA